MAKVPDFHPQPSPEDSTMLPSWSVVLGKMVRTSLTEFVATIRGKLGFSYPIHLTDGDTETFEKDYAIKGAELITEINVSPEVATVFYSKNGGAWIQVTPGTPLAITRGATDFLLYKVTYNGTEKACQISITGKYS